MLSISLSLSIPVLSGRLRSPLYRKLIALPEIGTKCLTAHWPRTPTFAHSITV